MAETITVNCHEFIVKRTQSKTFSWPGHGKFLSVFVHNSIFTKFIEVAQQQGFEVYDYVWDYPVRIGDERYSMTLLWLKAVSHTQNDTKTDLIANSRISFPWEEERTVIHMTQEKFHLVEDFVHQNGLKNRIRTEYTDSTLTYAPQVIKVTEFDNNVPIDLIKNFQIFMDSNGYSYPTNYYVRLSFRYLRPEFMKYYDKPFNNPDVITQVLLLLDYHRQQAKRGHEIFDVCDLIGMKMAIDDNRLEYDNCEFHKLLDHIFRDMADRKEYIDSRCFNLAEYRTNKGIILVSEEILEYLVYNFCTHFDSVALYWSTKIMIKLSKINVDKLIAMLHHYAHLYIDGSCVGEQSAEILMKILTNFKKSDVFVHFDTSFSWLYAGDGNRTSTNRMGSCRLILIGCNTFHFIENFINWLKLTQGSHTKIIDFVIVGAKSLRPYILRGFCVRNLAIHDIDLDLQLIDALADTRYENITIKQCRLGRDPNIVRSLEALHNVQEVTLDFKDSIGTIMAMLESRLTRNDTKHLRFRISIILYDADNLDRYIDLGQFEFYINNERTQIVNFDRGYKSEVYLYDYLYDRSIFGSRDEFEFYT